jgi:single-strand DNA-binding protein
MEGTTYPRMNRVLLTGIAQEEPELRYTPSGVAVCSFRVQVGRILRDRSGGAREVAAYLTVVAWQEAAQRMARELRKGQAVYVEGYVSSRSFTTARGEKRTAVEIYAEQIQILGPFAEGEKPTDGQTQGEESGAQRGGGRRPAPRGREEHPEEGGVPHHEEHHEMPHPAEDHHEDHHLEEPPGPEGAGDSEKLPL